MRQLSSVLSAVGLLLASGVSAGAQVTTLDEGAFQVSVNGAPAGTEAFSIRREGTGANAQVIASAEIRTQGAEGRLDMVPGLLTTGADMSVSVYEIKVSGAVQEEISLRSSGQRFVALTVSQGGEREREYRATPSAVVLDSGIAHQYYFLASRLSGGGGRVPVVAPRAGRQYEANVSIVGTENLTIGGQQLATTHLRIEGGGASREVWVDDEDRVLRVEEPATGYVAVRVEAP